MSPSGGHIALEKPPKTRRNPCRSACIECIWRSASDEGEELAMATALILQGFSLVRHELASIRRR